MPMRSASVADDNKLMFFLPAIIFLDKLKSTSHPPTSLVFVTNLYILNMKEAF